MGLSLSPRLVLRALPPLATKSLYSLGGTVLWREQRLSEELRPAGENRELLPHAALMKIGM